MHTPASSVAYISTTANRHPQVAESASSSLVAFGAKKLIALWNVSDDHRRGVFETLPGHQGLVTCVRFFHDDFMVSADDSGSLRSWRVIDAQWRATGTIQAHPNAISSLCILDDGLATGSSDASVKIWHLEKGATEDKIKEVQVLSFKGRFPLCIAHVRLPGSSVSILALGGTQNSIEVWSRSEDTFMHCATLAGHEDWIRSLAFHHPSPGIDQLILASGSQDSTIRLWKIDPHVKNLIACEGKPVPSLSDELLDDFETTLGDLSDSEEGGRQISSRRHIITVKSEGISQQYSITFDALLVGHESAVTSLSWCPESSLTSIPTLISTSTDASVIFWSPSTLMNWSKEESASLWINRLRFGDIGGQRLGGFVGGFLSSGGMQFMAWEWTGGWRRWQSSGSKTNGDGGWSEILAIGGHNDVVKGLDWSSKGEYLISAGLDRTTRIHAAVPSAAFGQEVWHELSRPQVHGYDLFDVAFLDALKFISIADEKVARVFEAPQAFVDVIESLQVAKFSTEERQRPLGASVPPLGLSNKAITESGPRASNNGDPVKRPPFEGELALGTLWPEKEKVFGHGYESSSLAVSYFRDMIATACRATSAEHAVVRVYNSSTWQLVGKPLEGHSLTVTRIAFSPDDRFILSVSRDRTWRLYQAQEDAGFTAVAANKAHGRIIWDCAWAHEGHIFATASRDKTVKIWRVSELNAATQCTEVHCLRTKEAATAVAFSNAYKHGCQSMAVGLESGEISIYTNNPINPSDWSLVLVLESKIAHVGHIYRLAWRPGQRQLASCSEDGTLKVITIQVPVASGVQDHP